MSRRLKLAVQNATAATALPTRAQLKAWAEAALQPGVKQAELTLRLVDAPEGQTLNREYRGKDYATNVLTFTFDDLPDIPGLPLMGDLVLCAPVVEQEAQEQDKPVLAHYCHLVVHGVLHLQGYDHQQEDEAQAMEALEAQIVTALGYDDPYRSDKES
ncbi:rRNA maturation RNase YbeY [Chitiniphilus purpureus]|uniref:Endoribonuclease YbeY n=1 Tax=Chitiniphilus purpureus TaxID=2981137 RepID=A0ABY6DP40_9NEIS|nr:rRNA maturation RNase YbeY [Chitiniphilus sp. CD1]UXY16129.1 rRNA maturation RNase YbeY [Chitiniphilus sp. CD1]